MKFMTFNNLLKQVGSIFIFLLIFLLESCEGYSCADGVVKDKKTNKPIDSVSIKVISGSQTIYTDTTGKFNVCKHFGGWVPKCKDITISFSKDSYKTITLTNPQSKVIVFMEK